MNGFLHVYNLLLTILSLYWIIDTVIKCYIGELSNAFIKIHIYFNYVKSSVCQIELL